MVQYWYNRRTELVEEGRQSLASELIGPFATRGEAERALEKLRENAAKWAAEDAAEYD
jgi:uncharacterized protein YfcZ (UPF0381/DUF406 family)